MKAVTTDFIFIIKDFWQWITKGNRWHGLVEGGIKHCHLTQSRKSFDSAVNAGQVSRVMKWCKWHQSFDLIDNSVIDNHGLREL